MSSPATRLVLWIAVSLALARIAWAGDAPGGRWRIMPVGDSITEGGATFSNYRPLLATKLRAAGFDFEFVGSRGPAGLRHEGYGGKNIEFLAATVPANFAQTPADIVLLHAGHNHFDTEQPAPSMIAATEKLIAAFRVTNPKVIILLAQVIPAGKLPKYSHLPEFNTQLARLAAKLHTPAQPVILVDQATGFDWPADTIADHVHPNSVGAGKMAERWFAVLGPLLATASAAAAK